MPPSSLYCCQRSVSMISAAARNRRIAMSPLVMGPLLSSANTEELFINPAPNVAAPVAAKLFFTKERRSTDFFIGSTSFFTEISFTVGGVANQHRGSAAGCQGD